MTYTLSSAKILKKVQKTKRNPFGYIMVETIPVDKPSVIAFGGELATYERATNSYAKQIQTLLLENNIQDVDVYSVMYDFGSGDAKLERAEQFRIAGRRLANENVHPIVKNILEVTLNKMRNNEPVPNYVKQLFEILLRPRISDSASLPLKPEEAIQKIRKIKFVAHCQGAATIWQLANYMYDEMIKMGYDKNDVKNIQKELFVIQHSPVAPLNKQKFTTLSFASAEDTMMRNHNNIFADWFSENSADVVPCYFDENHGNLFITGRLNKVPFNEHSNKGLTQEELDALPLTDDGKIIFTAERNAIVNAAKKSIKGAPITSVAEIVDGNGIDFKELKQNGDNLYAIMLSDVRRQNLTRARQK